MSVRRALKVFGIVLAFAAAAVVLTLLLLGPVHRQNVKEACAGSADKLPGCATTTTRAK